MLYLIKEVKVFLCMKSLELLSYAIFNHIKVPLMLTLPNIILIMFENVLVILFDISVYKKLKE